MSAVVDTAVLAVVVVRAGRLPAGAEEAAAEAGGAVLLVGSGAGPEAAGMLTGASTVWWADTPTGPAILAELIAPLLSDVRLVVLPASPDGRDLAPLLAARTRRPLLAGAVRAALAGEGGHAEADLLRVDGRVVVPVSVDGPAVATIWPGSRPARAASSPPRVVAVDLTGAEPTVPGAGAVELLELIEPDPATMDLADAPRVLAGGAGLVPAGATHEQARSLFALLSAVATALGASAGATRVITDAGWMGYDRQIGTTGVTLHPELYVALGISGATQHIGGIGDPERVVSVNLDASSPMTGRADLGLVADAPSLLVELAGRLGVAVPAEVEEVVRR